MNDDQSGQHFPDHRHLEKWPSDATGDRDLERYRPIALPKNLLILFLLSAAIVFLWFSVDYLQNRHERKNKAAAYEKANAIERAVKEQQRRDFLTTPRPDVDKAMRDYKFSTGEKTVTKQGEKQ